MLDHAIEYKYNDFKKIVLRYKVKVFELERIRVGVQWIKLLKVPQLIIDNEEIIEWLEDIYVGKGWKWKTQPDRSLFRIKKDKIEKMSINNRTTEGY